MRECVFLMIRSSRAIWHLPVTTRMRVWVAMASRHAEVLRSLVYACWSARVCARVAAGACVGVFA
jgi:hypothetical protein